MDDTDRFYFRQLLSGYDFAKSDQMARQMVNHVYLIGDKGTGEAVVVDPAYGIDDIVDIAEADGMKLVGALATHYHADHVGGSIMGYSIQGVAQLLERQGMTIHVNRNEAEFVLKSTGVSDSDLTLHDSGDVLEVGGVRIQFLHTPGHTPGSQCFLVDRCLVSGDTLFLEGCGRTDFPGSSPDDMFDSLQKLASLSDDVVLCPGHRYSPEPAALLGEVKRDNYVLQPRNKQQWMAMFGQ